MFICSKICYKKHGNVQPLKHPGRTEALCPGYEHVLVQNVCWDPRIKATGLVKMLAETGSLIIHSETRPRLKDKSNM